MKYFVYTMINLVAATTALALQSGDFSYTINSSNTNTVTITGHIGFNSSLEIPSSISNRSVVAIGKLAFYFDPYITDRSGLGFQTTCWLI
jgi:hypothetical protein